METQTQTQTDAPAKDGFILKNEPLGNTSVPLEDLPSVRLSPKQGEEIHSEGDYSLKLFYATRICPMTLSEVMERFPEPSLGKAQSVLNRYIDCELVRKTENGTYYSNYPLNYINYSDHRYDKSIEIQKDAKIFEIMKNHSGDKEYWKTKSYFSIDSFFTPEQTQELRAMFTNIKYKAKQFVHKNAQNKKIDGLKFRRLKFYDMILSVLFFVLVGTTTTQKAFAGNDPTQPNKLSDFIQLEPMMIADHDFFAGKAMAVNGKSANDTFDVALVKSILKDHSEMETSQTGETEKPIILALLKECEENLILSQDSPSILDQECLEVLTQAIMDECFNGNERACNELKSENLIVEI